MGYEKGRGPSSAAARVHTMQHTRVSSRPRPPRRRARRLRATRRGNRPGVARGGRPQRRDRGGPATSSRKSAADRGPRATGPDLAPRRYTALHTRSGTMTGDKVERRHSLFPSLRTWPSRGAASPHGASSPMMPGSIRTSTTPSTSRTAQASSGTSVRSASAPCAPWRVATPSATVTSSPSGGAVAGGAAPGGADAEHRHGGDGVGVSAGLHPQDRRGPRTPDLAGAGGGPGAR